MPFHDLNVPYTSNHADLAHTLSFHSELGYSVIALAVSVTGKLPPTPPSIPVSSLTIPKSITTVLTRLTLTISDTGQNHRLTSLQPQYSLLALRPTNEKALQLCCNSLDCDLISLDFSQRLPFVLKFKTVASALQRGVRFEISYSAGVQGGNADARRNLISGAAALIRATRGRGIILSSEAKSALGVRGPYDVINLAQVWGLGQERGKEALCEEAAKVVRLASFKRTSFRGVFDVIDGTGKASAADTVDGTRQASAREQKAENTAGSIAGRDSEVKHNGTASARSGTGTGTVRPTELNPERDTGSSTAGGMVVSKSNGMKRKASTASNTPTTTGTEQAPEKNGEEKPLSKREMKRRAKKARFEGKVAGLDQSAPDLGRDRDDATS